MDIPFNSWTSRFKNRVLREVAYIQDFMYLLMKPRNGLPWTAEDKATLRAHLKRLARSIPLLGIFCLPGGGLLLPILSMFLERRRNRKKGAACPAVERRTGGSPGQTSS